MKCKKCEYEIETELNFCPNCGAKLNEDAETVEVKEDVLSQKPAEKDESQTVMLTNPKLNIIESVIQFLFYFFLGMTIVTLAIGCKGFGLLKREINSVAVWVSFAISLVGAIACGIVYYVKFIRKK